MTYNLKYLELNDKQIQKIQKMTINKNSNTLSDEELLLNAKERCKIDIELIEKVLGVYLGEE